MKSTRKFRWYWLSIIMLLPVIVLTGVSNGADGLLNGKKYVGETGEKGKAKGDKEEFVFSEGKFDPVACHKYGFSSTSYTAKADGDTINFVAEHTGKKGDSLKWEGTVKEDKLEGIMMYRQGKKVPKEYWFKGELSK